MTNLIGGVITLPYNIGIEQKKRLSQWDSLLLFGRYVGEGLDPPLRPKESETGHFRVAPIKRACPEWDRLQYVMKSN